MKMFTAALFPVLMHYLNVQEQFNKWYSMTDIFKGFIYFRKSDRERVGADQVTQRQIVSQAHSTATNMQWVPNIYVTFIKS